MRYIKHLVRRYPMQSFLILFNAGVFTWLQTTGTMIAVSYTHLRAHET